MGQGVLFMMIFGLEAEFTLKKSPLWSFGWTKGLFFLSLLRAVHSDLRLHLHGPISTILQKQSRPPRLLLHTCLDLLLLQFHRWDSVSCAQKEMRGAGEKLGGRIGNMGGLWEGCEVALLWELFAQRHESIHCSPNVPNHRNKSGREGERLSNRLSTVTDPDTRNVLEEPNSQILSLFSETNTCIPS